MAKNETLVLIKNLCDGIEYNRQKIEHYRRVANWVLHDESLEKLIQLEAALADIMIEECLKRGVS